MLKYLPTFDEAHLYAAAMRDRGYKADVIHENAGHFWGAATTHGFPVLISKPAEEVASSESSEEPVNSEGIVDCVRSVFLALIFLGSLIFGCSLLYTVYLGLVSLREILAETPFGKSIMLIVLTAAGFAMVGFGIFLTQHFRRDGSPWARISYRLVAIIAGGLVVILPMISY